MAPPLRHIPEATVARLPVYLRCLLELAGANVTTVSSERLAERCGVNAAKVRKDLSHLGSYGTRGVGYDVEVLLSQISRELGLTQDWPVAIVGLGNLGHALANYRGFGVRGFRIVALFDADPARVGETIDGIAVHHIDDLPAVAGETPIAIGIIAVPAAGRPGRSPTAWSRPACRRSSTSPRRCSPSPSGSRCARSTSPSSCRS